MVLDSLSQMRQGASSTDSQRPIHKHFPDDDSDEDDGEEGIAVVVEDIPRQTIAGFLVRFAGRTACSRYPVRQVWQEVSNANYPCHSRLSAYGIPAPSVYCYGGRGRVGDVCVEAFAVIPCWHFPVPHSLATASGASPVFY